MMLTGLSSSMVYQSALDEREQIGVDRVCLCGGHPVWEIFVCLQRAVLEELG
jgi:hypothetical protein